ncbi:MAG: hypothetical protein AB1489_35380 [Acidobacteriota bacterium]
MNGKVPKVPPLSCYEIGKIAEEFIGATYPSLLKEPSPFPIDRFFEGTLGLFGFEYAVSNLPIGVEGATDLRTKEDKSKCRLVLAKSFKHWRSGKIYYAKDYGKEAFTLFFRKKRNK